MKLADDVPDDRTGMDIGLGRAGWLEELGLKDGGDGFAGSWRRKQ